MDFEGVFQYLINSFKKHNIDFALIGGFAMQIAGHTKTTQDIDLLVLKEDLSKIKVILFDFGYELVFESKDVSHFQGKMKPLGSIDLLHAYQKYSMNMLKRAREYAIINEQFKVKVIRPEDLIGLKVQASSNDSERYSKDLADIEVILKNNKEELDLNQVREYFALFNRETELDEILGRIDNVK